MGLRSVLHVLVWLDICWDFMLLLPSQELQLHLLLRSIPCAFVSLSLCCDHLYVATTLSTVTAALEFEVGLLCSRLLSLCYDAMSSQDIPREMQPVSLKLRLSLKVGCAYTFAASLSFTDTGARTHGNTQI